MKNKALKKYCLYCDGEYTAQRADSKYCCDSCRKMASRSRCKGGIGYRQNINSLPRHERQLENIAPNSVTGANQVSTQWAGNSNSSQLSVNNNSTNEVKPSTNHQLIVNEALEKIKFDLAAMKIKAETTAGIEDSYRDLYKKQLIKDLGQLLKWGNENKVSLTLLNLTTKSIAETIRIQRDIFKDNPDDYNFLVAELIPKLKEYTKTARRERGLRFEFSINEKLVEQINKILANMV